MFYMETKKQKNVEGVTCLFQYEIIAILCQNNIISLLKETFSFTILIILIQWNP